MLLHCLVLKLNAYNSRIQSYDKEVHDLSRYQSRRKDLWPPVLAFVQSCGKPLWCYYFEMGYKLFGMMPHNIYPSELQLNVNRFSCSVNIIVIATNKQLRSLSFPLSLLPTCKVHSLHSTTIKLVLFFKLCMASICWIDTVPLQTIQKLSQKTENSSGNNWGICWWWSFGQSFLRKLLNKDLDSTILWYGWVQFKT